MEINYKNSQSPITTETMDNPDQEAYLEWHKGLEEIEPLIEYYSRQVGQLSGRLLTALSFLADLENGHDWDSHTTQVREAVHFSSLLIASVLKIVAAAQLEQDDESDAAKSIQDLLKRLSNNRDGG